MKSAALISAQFHRNPQLIEPVHEIRIREDSRPPRRPVRRRRRP